MFLQLLSVLKLLITGFVLVCACSITTLGLTVSQGPTGANLDFARSIGSGNNVVVGLIDTVPIGIAPFHQLGDRLQIQLDFRFIAIGDDPLTILLGEDGHETLVADIIGGGDPTYRGSAPGVNVYLAAISSDYASFQTGTAWIADAIGAKLINISAGWGTNGNGTSDRERYLDWLARTHDMLIVKSAGNTGGQLSDPGGFYNGITVGSFDEATQGRYQYSAYQLASSAEARGKPEILAPGVTVTDGVSFDGFPLSGTSFAAPHVSGTAAVLMELGTEQLGGTHLGRMATKALILNSARKRGIADPEAGLAQSYDYSANNGNDRNYLAADDHSFAPGATTSRTNAWTPTTWSHNGTTFSATRPLDDEQGVGLLDTSRAVINILGGRQTPGSVSGIGWDFGTLAPEGLATYTLAQAIPAGNFLTATLVWDRIVSEADGDGAIDLDDVYVFQELANIDLRLRDGMGTIIAQSISTADNLEHLHVPITSLGALGDYSLEVIYNGGGVLPTDYALAWWVGSEGLLPGDYNYDGIVDAADYDSWQPSFGQAPISRSGFATGDGNGDGAIDLRDYVVWRDHFGGSLQNSAAVASIPEPSAMALAGLALVGIVAHARRRK